MKILAFDFSSPSRTVALYADDRVCGHAVEAGTKESRPLALVEQVLKAGGVERQAVDGLAVGLGPGSYTGIRASIALVQGWQLARETKVIGISSVECLAAQARAEQVYGRVNVVVDAQREEVYWAIYEISVDGCREIEPLRLATPADVRGKCGAGEVIIGPEAQRWFPEAQTLCPDAATVATLAAARSDWVRGEALEPIYLRMTNYVKAPPPRSISTL